MFIAVFAVVLLLFLAAGGVLYGTSHEGSDVNTWHITSDGQLCRTWHVWDSRGERCYAVPQGGESFELEPQDTWGRRVVRGRPGNPEGY